MPQRNSLVEILPETYFPSWNLIPAILNLFVVVPEAMSSLKLDHSEDELKICQL